MTCPIRFDQKRGKNKACDHDNRHIQTVKDLIEAKLLLNYLLENPNVPSASVPTLNGVGYTKIK